MLGEELMHPRIDVVSVDRESTLGEKPRVDSRSRAEVEKLCAGWRDAEDEIPKRRARAAIRLLRSDLTDILRARWSALQVSNVAVVATHAVLMRLGKRHAHGMQRFDPKRPGRQPSQHALPLGHSAPPGRRR